MTLRRSIIGDQSNVITGTSLLRGCEYAAIDAVAGRRERRRGSGIWRVLFAFGVGVGRWGSAYCNSSVSTFVTTAFYPVFLRTRNDVHRDRSDVCNRDHVVGFGWFVRTRAL